MASVELQTARAYGKSIGSMQKHHGDSFMMYELAVKQVRGRVLDIACGTGTGTAYLAQHADEVVGADIDAGTIAYCKRTHKAPNLHFIKADATKRLPFPDRSFDVITTFETIEHLYAPERRKYLAQLRRVLKDDGFILLSTPNNGMDRQLLTIPPPAHPYDHKIEFCLKELRAELAKARFSIMSEGGVFYKLQPKGRLAGTPSAKHSVIFSLQSITKYVPTSLKEQIGHRIMGYPYHIRHFSYSRRIPYTLTFYLKIKKK